MAAGDKDVKYAMPVFNPETNGVYWPFHMCMSEPGYINLDGADLSTILGAYSQPPVTMECISVDCIAVADGQGAKGGAASAEPVVRIVHGTATLASGEAGSTIVDITCTGAAPAGTKWSGSTTRFTIAPTEMVAAYLQTAAASATSTNQDGGAIVVLYMQPLSTP